MSRTIETQQNTIEGIQNTIEGIQRTNETQKRINEGQQKAIEELLLSNKKSEQRMRSISARKLLNLVRGQDSDISHMSQVAQSLVADNSKDSVRYQWNSVAHPEASRIAEGLLCFEDTPVRTALFELFSFYFGSSVEEVSNPDWLGN